MKKKKNKTSPHVERLRLAQIVTCPSCSTYRCSAVRAVNHRSVNHRSVSHPVPSIYPMLQKKKKNICRYWEINQRQEIKKKKLLSKSRKKKEKYLVNFILFFF